MHAYLWYALQRPVILRHVESLNVECWDGDQGVADLVLSCFEDADLEVQVLGEAGCEGEASGTAADDDEVEGRGDEVVNGAED